MQYLAAKASNTESLLTSNDDLPAYVDQHVRVSTRDKERLLGAWRDVMEVPLAACAACGVRAPPHLPCGSVLRADDTDTSASDEDEEGQPQTLDFDVVRERVVGLQAVSRSRGPLASSVAVTVPSRFEP